MLMEVSLICIFELTKEREVDHPEEPLQTAGFEGGIPTEFISV